MGKIRFRPPKDDPAAPIPINMHVEHHPTWTLDGSPPQGVDVTDKPVATERLYDTEGALVVVPGMVLPDGYEDLVAHDPVTGEPVPQGDAVDTESEETDPADPDSAPAPVVAHKAAPRKRAPRK